MLENDTAIFHGNGKFDRAISIQSVVAIAYIVLIKLQICARYVPIRYVAIREYYGNQDNCKHLGMNM